MSSSNVSQKALGVLAKECIGRVLFEKVLVFQPFIK
jgi:hypothetical protein